MIIYITSCGIIFTLLKGVKSGIIFTLLKGQDILFVCKTRSQISVCWKLVTQLHSQWSGFYVLCAVSCLLCMSSPSSITFNRISNTMSYSLCPTQTVLFILFKVKLTNVWLPIFFLLHLTDSWIQSNNRSNVFSCNICFVLSMPVILTINQTLV